MALLQLAPSDLYNQLAVLVSLLCSAQQTAAAPKLVNGLTKCIYYTVDEITKPSLVPRLSQEPKQRTAKDEGQKWPGKFSNQFHSFGFVCPEARVGCKGWAAGCFRKQCMRGCCLEYLCSSD